VGPLLNTRLSTAVFCLKTYLSFHELQRKSLHIIPVTSVVHQTITAFATQYGVFSSLTPLLISCSLSVTIESTNPHCRERATSVPAVATNRQAPPCTFTPQFAIQLRAHRPTLARGLTDHT